MPRRPKPWYRKDRDAWFVTIDGKRHNLGSDREAAEQRFHQLMASPQKRVVASDQLVAIIDAYLEWCSKHRAADTYEWYRFRLERFARVHPDLRVDQLRPFHVQEWLDGMDVANGTRRNYGRVVKRCVRWAKQQGYIELNPIADMQLPKGGKRDRVLSAAEWSGLLDAAPSNEFRDLLVVTWETGCRPQESLRVEARHVDLGHQRWVFPETESKTGVPRIVYLTDTAAEITRRLMLRSPDRPLFRNGNGRPWTTGQLCLHASPSPTWSGNARREDERVLSVPRR